MTDKAKIRQLQIHQWLADIKEQKASRLTVGQWCEEHEISKNQFYYRLRAVRDALVCNAAPTIFVGQETIPATDSTTGHVMEPQVVFAELPAAVFPATLPEPVPAAINGTTLRLHYGRSTVEVGNDASDRILEFLWEVILHGE